MRKNRSGQTLIEVLVTIVIIGIGVIALLRYQNYLGYSYSLAIQRNDAIRLAEQRIEILRDYNVLPTTSGYTAYDDINSGSSVQTVGNTSFTITWTVSSFTDPTYKILSVSVAWVDRNSLAQNIRLVSRVAAVEPATSATIM